MLTQREKLEKTATEKKKTTLVKTFLFEQKNKEQHCLLKSTKKDFTDHRYHGNTIKSANKNKIRKQSVVAKGPS